MQYALCVSVCKCTVYVCKCTVCVCVKEKSRKVAFTLRYMYTSKCLIPILRSTSISGGIDSLSCSTTFFFDLQSNFYYIIIPTHTLSKENCAWHAIKFNFTSEHVPYQSIAERLKVLWGWWKCADLHDPYYTVYCSVCLPLYCILGWH